MKEVRYMTREELVNHIKFLKDEIKSLHHSNGKIPQLRYYSNELKAALLVIKKQLENISNNIIFSKNNKGISKLYYQKGGSNKTMGENENGRKFTNN